MCNTCGRIKENMLILPKDNSASSAAEIYLLPGELDQINSALTLQALRGGGCFPSRGQKMLYNSKTAQAITLKLFYFS